MMRPPVISQLLSKEAFYKAYPQLYYGVEGEWFIVKTPDDKICGLALSSFPNPQSLLRIFRKHILIEKSVSFPQTPAYLLAGTPLQHQVWKALLEIPSGIIISYQELAKRLNVPKAVRAVANAVGANPISPLIPCHRIVRSNRHLGGYHWGLLAKANLLRKEGVELSSLKGLPMGVDKEYREVVF